MDKEITLYIEKRYERWLDYSRWHCTNANMEGESVDVLNEVIVSLLENDELKLKSLYDEKKGNYNGLDFFILRMIKLNIYSPTSPYHKLKRIPRGSVDEYNKWKKENLSKYNISLEDEDVEDKPAEILDKIHIVRDVLEQLYLSERAKKIFEYRFFGGFSFSKWEGPEGINELYEIYNKVIEMIKDKLNGRFLI